MYGVICKSDCKITALLPRKSCLIQSAVQPLSCVFPYATILQCAALMMCDIQCSLFLGSVPYLCIRDTV